MTEDNAKTQSQSLWTPGRIIASGLIVALVAFFGYKILFGGAEVKTDSKATLPGGSAPAAGTALAASAAPPDFVIPSVDGRTFKLSEYRGKVLVMDFWATWCPPCRAETPHLASIAREYGSQGVEVVGLHIDDRGRSSLDTIRTFVKEYKINYTVGLATDEMFVDYLGREDDTIPQTLVFGRDGNVIAHFIGFDEDHAQALEDAVKRGLGRS
ncbi:MAG TPA: TlpA disulfide reductase family protein [Blastocatellia bacterium]|nr:TlpA disulfide reductase family protein [Blastocatellia bacterium]